MDIAKIREMSDRELEDALNQAKQDLWSARFALSTRQLNDTSSIPRTRHTIARILMVRHERASGAAPARPAPERTKPVRGRAAAGKGA
jgi:ribosomal protein L29